MRFLIATLVALPLLALSLSPPSSRTSPPFGAKIVRAGTTTGGEYTTLGAAVAALPSDSSSQTIFIYPGTYNEQVNIQRSGPVTLLGYTTDPGNFSSNQVELVASVPASTAGSNDASGTLRIHTDGVKIYNINIRNDYGQGSQAIALSQYGNQVGVYACGIYGFQDTLLANQGTQVYLQNYIEGATDFIFGRLGQAYFEGNTIGVKSNGWVTASGREADNVAIYIFEQNNIILASDPGSTDKIYLGRPWGDYARVIFKDTYVTAPLNPSIWSIWNTGDERTDNVLFADFNTTGPGVPSNAERPSFVTVLNSSQAASYTISTAVGNSYATWVDADYLL
ncbi:hypothetical protein EW146_g3618 [Bondarzewia mesenterica]|uniref:Pectinesterase n=1 Tax=Bondarzewia mesenterica TaxID=1095465 RepID=A0A4S4LX17_9AGAM|nr:hypothetical protein EW146_g3618 [Bondarzewia mesenterica]